MRYRSSGEGKTRMNDAIRVSSIEASIDALIEKVGRKLVLAMPLGIGKPNVWINALYQRAKNDPSIELRIITALSLDRPKGRSLVERRFLDPFVQRVFGDYPDMDYALDARRGKLPPNVMLSEFFLKTGADVGNSVVQSNYIYSNYTHAVRDAFTHGVNVFAQAMAIEENEDGERLSLSCNPDLTLDAMDMAMITGKKTMVLVGVVNRTMPFMPNDAVLRPDQIDILVDDPAATHAMFGPPNMKIDDQDYGIALWSSTLVKDGGTLQIGIGSLGDGIAHVLIERDRDNKAYRNMIAALSEGKKVPAAQELEPFREGLYGCSEMFVNGFMALIDAGVIRREVFNHDGLQRLLNAGRIGLTPDEGMLNALFEARIIGSPLSRSDVSFLHHFGILRKDVDWVEGRLICGERVLPSEVADPQVRAEIAAHLLGDRLRHGYVLHGGFFIGPNSFYNRLRELPRDVLQKINMTRISYINELFGHENVAREQRRDARFINTTMMATLLGAAVSDGLDTGELVSGVGGQYNFVAQAHTLPDARSILMLRSWRLNKKGKPVSNIVWSYGHITIPRHLRDIFVTEYGIADLRGMSDSEVVKRMLAVADSRFQDGLLETAKRHGKIEADYVIPAEQRNNFPETIEARLATFRAAGKLPDFPFGTDFDAAELATAKVLMKLKERKASPLAMAKTLLNGLTAEPDPVVLQRLGLERPASLEERILRTLVSGC